MVLTMGPLSGIYILDSPNKKNDRYEQLIPGYRPSYAGGFRLCKSVTFPPWLEG